jgi:hypothetical protein
MVSSKVSLRRRQVLIAGLAGASAPALAGRFQSGEPGAVPGEHGLVVSGRILARNGRPLSGAVVEVWHASARANASSATTDGDGRFFATIASSRHGRPQDLRYRVSRAGRALTTQRLHFARGRSVSEDSLAHLQRDEAGTWRAAFGISLA